MNSSLSKNYLQDNCLKKNDESKVKGFLVDHENKVTHFIMEGERKMNQLTTKEKVMTIKEIAKLVNLKSTKTVLNWIKNGQKLPITIGQKLTIVHKEKKPAQFTLEETLSIVRASGNETLADLLLENVSKTMNITPKNSDVEERFERLEGMVEKLISSIPLIVTETVKALNSQPKQIEYQQDYFTVTGYSNFKNIQITSLERSKIGKEASRLSIESEMKIKQIPDERWGFIGSYHISILEKAFNIVRAKDFEKTLF